MDSRLLFILNDAAGSSSKADAAESIARICRERGLTSRILLAKSGAEIADMARHALSSDNHAVVAGGGDGTLNAVASVLVGSDLPLGILPLGTLNHLAKDLRIPLKLEDAIETVIAGNTEKIDVGEVNGRIFLNNSGLGLYPQLVEQRARQQRLGVSKWIAFFRALRSVLKRHPFLIVRLHANGEALLRKTPLVFVGNNQYSMEGISLGKRARLDAGCLSLYVARVAGRAGLLAMAVRALLGRLQTADNLDAICTQEISVQTGKKKLRVATDGEVNLIETPLHYRILPQALRVIVPVRAPEVAPLEAAITGAEIN